MTIKTQRVRYSTAGDMWFHGFAQLVLLRWFVVFLSFTCNYAKNVLNLFVVFLILDLTAVLKTCMQTSG